MGSHSDTIAAPHSLPGCAAPFADEIRAIEAELDTLWAGYARIPLRMPDHSGRVVLYEGYKLKGRPFTASGHPAPPYRIEHVRRLKWLLKRHMLLMQGLDVGVTVTEGAGRQKGRCFAHPTSEQKPHPEPPRKVAPPNFPQPEQRRSAAREALETGQPLEVVKRDRARPWRP